MTDRHRLAFTDWRSCSGRGSAPAAALLDAAGL
jgi:hypothetical protein